MSFRNTLRLRAPALALAALALAAQNLAAQNLAAARFVQERSPAPRTAAAGAEGLEELRLRSDCLSAFWGREVFVEGTLVLPPDHDPAERLPICFSIHGFGGSHRVPAERAAARRLAMAEGRAPRMLLVYLNAQLPMGHHEFADSVNNGPWGRALTTEYVPALEARYATSSGPECRFLTGHSSGGWSSLWLQVTYPDFFNGTWSTAPDSVDFRDFTGIDVYTFENAFVDPEGADVPLIRRGGEWVATIREFVQRERERQPVGGQFYSFNAVFSPRGPDGTPLQLFDWETGAIDRDVAESWRKYDITQVLVSNWETLGPRLAGKLHIYMGAQDTFRLEGATRLLKAALEELGSDAEVLLVEGRDHGTLFRPHPELWPDGMLDHVHRAMAERFAATAGR